MAGDFEALLARSGAGDRAARDELVARLYPRVSDTVHRELERDFRKSHRWILPLFSTGDVVHDVFAQVVRAMERFEGKTEDEVARYLAGVVKHRLVDAVRFHEAARRDQRRKVQEPEDEGAGGPTPMAFTPPGEVAALAEQVAVFREVVAEFEPRQRTLLEMRLVDDEPFGAIADALGYASPDSARKVFHELHARLLLKLRARGLRAPGEGE